MLIDLLFPKYCVACGGEGSWLCLDCFLTIEMRTVPACADCQRLTKDGRYCRFHVKAHALTGLLSVGDFSPGALREAIHVLKYNGVRELAIPLGYLLAKRLSMTSKLEKAVIVPVPLHASREGERGFNQAILLARELDRPILTRLVIRHRKTVPQAKLDHVKRRTNLQGVFGLRADQVGAIQNKTVIVVDDVSTTGSTLDEIASLLKRYGARQVWGLVLAKG